MDTDSFIAYIEDIYVDIWTDIGKLEAMFDT